MSTIDIPIETSPLSERLGLLSRIRESLPPNYADTEEIEMPDWHAEILRERLKEVEEGRGEWVELDEVRERLTRLYQ